MGSREGQMPNYRVLAIRNVIERVAANDGTFDIATDQVADSSAALRHSNATLLIISHDWDISNPACHSRLSSPSGS